MHVEDVRRWLCTQRRAYRAQLRFSVRVTVAAISALLIAQFFSLPLRGLWVVLTATVVTQLSVGGSLADSPYYGTSANCRSCFECGTACVYGGTQPKLSCSPVFGGPCVVDLRPAW